MTSHSSASHDDAFHEIQLNGKQLFFLFMAATVVSVVIFLCGVLVGRGVRAERTAADIEALNSSPSPDAPPPNTPAGGAGADPTIVLPPPPAEEVSEVGPNTPVGNAEPGKAKSKEAAKEAAPAPKVSKPEPPPARAAEPPAPKPAPAATSTTGTARPATPAPPPAAASPAAAAATPAAVRDWFVQVAAVLQKGEADPYVKRLAAKGYEARVVPPSDGTNFFRIRVGNFKTRPEAQLLADKIQKDLGITPYVNR